MKEIHTRVDLAAHLAAGQCLTDVAIQGLDLRGFEAQLAEIEVDGAILLGCEVEPELLCDLNHRGCIVFPELSGLPYDPFRPHLYCASELFDAFDPAEPTSYCESLDGRVYQHYLNTGKSEPRCIRETLARRLHDHAMTDALHDFLEVSPQARRGVIAIMGGHSMRRDSQQYQRVAEVSRRFARQGYLMVSGGGPGAMEATHLGAWFVDQPVEQMYEAIRRLADFGSKNSKSVPDYRQRLWLANAVEVMRAFPPPTDRHTSLGIPTWLYGHEPPTPLATHIAKYFANSVREEGLITIATAGIVFAAGSFGTFQEVFQDAAQNHYATAPAQVSPMVFLGRDYWETEKPLFPLLEKLGEHSQLKPYLHLTDSVDEVVRFINESPPATGGSRGWSFCEYFNG